MEEENIFVAVGQTLFAIFGSYVRWLNQKDYTQRKFVTLLSEVMSAMLIGLLVFCVYKWLMLNLYLSFALAGILGHQGAKGLERLAFLLEQKTGIDLVDDEEYRNKEIDRDEYKKEDKDDDKKKDKQKRK